MKLEKFLKKFSHNNIIRLWYREKGIHICAIQEGKSTSMDWEVLRGEGVNAPYINHKVLGLLGIMADNEVESDVINIVIERNDKKLIGNRNFVFDLNTEEYKQFLGAINKGLKNTDKISYIEWK